MVVASVVLSFLKALQFALSVTFLLLIGKYISKKPLGMQTVLDFLILDCVRLLLAVQICSLLFIIMGLYDIKVDFVTAQVLLYTINNTFCLLVAMVQMTIVVKAIIIFGEAWISEAEDSVIIGVVRLLALTYSQLRFLVDFLPEPRPTIIIKYLTGTDEKT